MCADVVGSTALYEALGDARAQQLVADCLQGLTAHCVAHGGRIVAEIGDQIVAVFADPTRAAGAASEMHADLHEAHARDGGTRIRLRVGLHYGPIESGPDLLSGGTARIASWASHNAKPEQTLATRPLIDQLPRLFRAVSRYVDDETWDLSSLEHVELYEIIWDVEAITAYNGEKVARDAQTYERVEFSHAGRTVSVSAERPVISIGRGPRNDLVIAQDLVSRQHLSAQFSRGRCTITDNSTNGSVVIAADGSRYELKRESCRLTGSGIIIPGKPRGEEAAFAISYRCL
jgi:class 3 adenylate cyclase